MGLLDKLFGKLRGKIFKPSPEETGEIGREKFVEGSADKPAREQYEFKTSLKRGAQQQSRPDTSRQQETAMVGLELLKSRATMDTRYDEKDTVSDSPKPFSSYAKRKAVPKEARQADRKPELVDLGKVTSTIPSEGAEEFALITSRSFAKSSQSPPPPPKSAPPPPPSVPPRKSPVSDVKSPEFVSEPQKVTDSSEGKIVMGMDIPEAALSYHKNRIELKAGVETDKQDIESVIERFVPVKEPVDKSVGAGVVERVQDTTKPTEAEQVKISDIILEKPTEKLTEKLVEKPLEKLPAKPRTGRFIYPPFWRRKRPADEVITKPQFKATQLPKKGAKPTAKPESRKIDTKAAKQPVPKAAKSVTETKEELVAPELIFEETGPFTSEGIRFKPSAERASVTESVEARGARRAEGGLVDAFSQAFETLMVFGEGATKEEAESSEGLIEYHPEEVEDLNQMFLQMLSNYLKPLEEGFDTLENGEYDDETVAGLLGAVRPLRGAALTMRFDKISELLKEIEEPLQVYRLGEIKRFRPTQLASMVLSYRQLFNILPRAKVLGDIRRHSAASELLKVLKTVPEASSEYIEKLFACGFSTLDAVRTTLPYEIAITCGIPEEIAYKIHAEVVKNMEREE